MTSNTHECGGLFDLSPTQAQIVRSIAEIFGIPKQEVGIDAFIIDSTAVVLPLGSDEEKNASSQSSYALIKKESHLP